MIFIGDIASPDTDTSKQLERFFMENTEVFNNKRLLCNFEGLISERKVDHNNQPVLFNHPSILRVLNRGMDPVICLANNHILDIPIEFDTTINILASHGIGFCGAARSKDEALKPMSFVDNEKQIVLFNACWNFLLYNHRNPSKGIYVAEINEQWLIKEIELKKKTYPNSAIIVYLHWSFDLETLPFPMYRQFSMDLIDAGANVVIGSHSHCVQGGEKHGNGYIIYGLGNFFLPYGTFAGGRLTFPDFARIQLALEWDHLSNKSICHWFEYQNKDGIHSLEFLSSEEFEVSIMLAKYTPYSNMTETTYLKYFKKYRRKKILVPIYKNYKSILLNKCITSFLRLRAHTAHQLAKLKLRNWQN